MKADRGNCKILLRQINNAIRIFIFTLVTDQKQSRMKIYKLTYNPFQENCYVLVDEDNNGIIIDPGCYVKEEQDHFLDFLNSYKIKPIVLLNTHGHIDHIMGNAFVKRNFDVDLYLHKEDLFLLEGAGQSAHLYGLNAFEPSPTPDQWLEDGQKLKFGSIELEVIFGPGHAPGHVAFYCEKEGIVINGDILFQGSYGRVDLPGGDFATLKKTITERMFKLPDNTVVYTGHGPETTIGVEKQGNPILM